MSAAPDFAIIGGGIIGLSIARALSAAGRIVVLERGQPGAEASGAAAGLLTVASVRAPRGVLFDLKRASAALFPKLVDELRDESGIDVEYQRDGLLAVAFTSREAEELDRLVARRAEQGFAAERLDGDAVRERYPEVNPAVRRGGFFADDAQINNTRMVEALYTAVNRRGVDVRLATPVERIDVAGERVVAVHAGGQRLTPGHVLVAGGPWSADIGVMLGIKIPVRTDRGEMVAVRPRTPLPAPMSWRDGYLVPRANGEVLIGATSARGVTDKVVTAANTALLLSRAVRMVPALADAGLLRAWAGLRPLCTLRRPIIGPPRGLANVTIATGHHRSGILLAPITAQLVTELLTRRETSIDLRPFCWRAR